MRRTLIGAIVALGGLMAGGAVGSAMVGQTSSAAPGFGQLGADIDDGAGGSVALSEDGGRVAFGEPFGEVDGVQVGLVKVFDWDGTTWTKVGADLTGIDNQDEFGHAVALSNDGRRLAVGAPAEIWEDAGYVRVFDWDGTTWNQVGTDLVDPIIGHGGHGWSVSLSGDGNRIAITSVEVAHSFVYDWDGTSWIPARPDITGVSTAGSPILRVALSDSGSRLAIGAQVMVLDEFWEPVPGFGRIYDWDDATWTQVGADVREASLDGFGSSVALSGNGTRVAFGGPGTDSASVGAYESNGTSWTQIGAAITRDGGGFAFGHSIALTADGNRIAISDHTLVTLHDWSGTAWVQTEGFADDETSAVQNPPQIALSDDGSRIAVTRPRWRVYEGPVAAAPVPPPSTTPPSSAPPSTTATVDVDATLPPTGVDTARGTGLLATTVLLVGLGIAAITRRRS